MQYLIEELEYDSTLNSWLLTSVEAALGKITKADTTYRAVVFCAGESIRGEFIYHNPKICKPDKDKQYQTWLENRYEKELNELKDFLTNTVIEDEES